MKFPSRSLLAVAIALASKGALSADTYLHVFYDNNPLQGLNIKFDGEVKGQTDSRGASSIFMLDGEHTVEIIREEQVISSFSFISKQDEDAEISVTFSGSMEEPDVKIQKFASDDNSASGFIGGVVSDQNGNPVSGAVIETSDGITSIQTASDGSYELKLPRGEYQLSVSHPNFVTTQLTDVRIFSDVGVAASLRLTPKSERRSINIEMPVITMESPIEEVLTIGTYKPMDSSQGIERFTSTVIDAIDAQQLERFGDSNVAIALTRIAGVAVTDGKYAVVRGLDGRYVSSALNGLLMPSTDPVRRDVQLDLFPSNIVSGIEIQKTYSPDLPGTTTGGSVLINTKGLPDERVLSASLSVGYLTDTTGEEIVTYEESNTDFWGYDSGLRHLPYGILDATGQGLDQPQVCQSGVEIEGCLDFIELAGLGVSFQDDYDVDTKTANPDFKVSASWGDKKNMDFGGLGFYSGLSFGHSTKSRTDTALNDARDIRGEYLYSQENVNLSAYLVGGFEFRDADEILSKTVFIRDTDNTTRVKEGIVVREDVNSKKVSLEWVEREFISQQFTGKHVLELSSQSHQLDWRLGLSESSRYEPDRRTYQYRADVFIPSTLERRWSDLTEESTDFGLDYIANFEFSSSVRFETKLGFLSSDRNREVDMYRFSTRLGSGDTADYVDLSADRRLEEILPYQAFIMDEFRLRVATTDTDSYTADEEVTAYYLDTKTDIGESITIAAGVRQEEFESVLRYPNADLDENPLLSEEALPALNLTYRVTDDFQIRAGWSKTVSYPGITERSESTFYDPETDEIIFGNSDLVVSTIDNIDLRFEYYFSDEESVSLAFFNKEIDNPTEKVKADASGSAAAGFTFRNSDSATLNGVEIDGFKNLYDGVDYRFFVSGNLSFIESEVTLDEVGLRIEGEDDIGRELQGQSPFLANLQIGFDHFPSEQKVTILVNHYDDKIFAVTRGENVGPQYEEGRTLVNINYEKVFDEKLTFKAQLKNLLNAEYNRIQNGVVFETYKEGISLSMDLSYDF